MKNINKLKNKSIYKQTQKGKISLIKRKGYLYKNGYIGLRFNEPTSLTDLQLKALKVTINYYLGKEIEKIWNINPKISRSKRQGVRMGKGKSKISNYIHRYTKNSIFLILKPKKIEEELLTKTSQINKLLYNNLLLKKLEKGLIKIKLKFHKLSITSK